MSDIAILERAPMQARMSLKERFLTTDEETHKKNIAENFEKLRFRDAEAYNSAKEGEPVTDTMDVAPAYAPAPSMAAARIAQYTPLSVPAGKRELFGEAVNGESALQDAQAQDVSVSAIAPESPFTEEDDAVPTRRTMDTLHRPAAKQEEGEAVKTGILSMLSTKTKIVLAALTAVVLLFFVLVCVNTSLIRSIDSDIAGKQAELAELTRETESVQAQIADLTSPENIAKWAENNNMTLDR